MKQYFIKAEHFCLPVKPGGHVQLKYDSVVLLEGLQIPLFLHGEFAQDVTFVQFGYVPGKLKKNLVKNYRFLKDLHMNT